MIRSEQRADAYDDDYASRPLLTYDLQVLQRGFAEPGRFLDLGCGTGRALIALGRRGFEVTGIDLSPRMLQIARRKTAEAGVMPAALGQGAAQGRVEPGVGLDRPRVVQARRIRGGQGGDRHHPQTPRRRQQGARKRPRAAGRGRRAGHRFTAAIARTVAHRRGTASRPQAEVQRRTGGGRGMVSVLGGWPAMAGSRPSAGAWSRNSVTMPPSN
ncbi:MAG: class I SAM-dependent methyltransferase [Planctomycetes bacterium]|nr:class I SAM-dependent methyltransferase [Planctomycetota bacterium]